MWELQADYKKLQELYQRIEAAKYNTKQYYGIYFPTMGAFELDPAEYRRLVELLKIARVVLKKKGIEKFDLDALPPLLRDKIVEIYLKGMNKEIDRFDASKRLFFMIDLYVPKKRIDETLEKVKLEEIVSSWVENTSVLVVTIEGYMGTGKTDFSLKLAESLIRIGAAKHIISNVEVFTFENNYLIFAAKYHKITKLSDLIELLFLLRDEGKVFVLDEAAIHLMHRRSSSSKSVILAKLLVLFRKLKTHVVLTIQNKSLLDKIFRDVVANNGVHVEKLSKEEAVVYDAIHTKKYRLVDIKPTMIPFDSDYLAPFAVDIPEELLDDILLLLDRQDATIEDLRKLLYAGLGVASVSPTELAFYEFMLQNKEFTRKDVEIALNVSERTAQRLLQGARQEGIVEMRGSGSKISYIVTEEGVEVIKKRLGWARQHMAGVTGVESV